MPDAAVRGRLALESGAVFDGVLFGAPVGADGGEVGVGAHAPDRAHRAGVEETAAAAADGAQRRAGVEGHGSTDDHGRNGDQHRGGEEGGKGAPSVD